MNVYTENSDVILRMTPREAMELANQLRAENHPLAYRLAVASSCAKAQQKRAQPEPIQDIPAHSAELDLRDISER